MGGKSEKIIPSPEMGMIFSDLSKLPD
jgi:hypothetical protein